MMKSKSLIASLMMFAASVLPIAAQNEIVTVQLEELPYTYVEPEKSTGDKILSVVTALAGETTDNNNEGFRAHVNNDVKTALSNVRRISIMDEYSDTPMFRITGEIPLINTTTSENTYTEKDKKGKTYTRVEYAHGANITVNLTTTNLLTGEMFTETFKASEFPSEYVSKDEALVNASNTIRKKVTNYFNSMFPLMGSIIERGETKNDKEKQVYLDLGGMHRVNKGLQFDVFKIGQVAGRETRSKIGQLKIEEVLGDDISLCKVTKGKKEIKAALDSGATVVAVSN